MADRKKEDNANVAQISRSMINSIKKEMFKYKYYDDFLFEVEAMKKTDNAPIVNKYKNEDIKWYEEKYIKKHQQGINDAFVFEQYATHMKNVAQEGKPQWVNSGYFIPRSFWDFVSKQKYEQE